MPAAAPLIASAAISAGVGAALGVTLLGLGIAGSAVLVFGATLALGMVQQALVSRVDFSVGAGRRTITARNATAARRQVPGQARVGGTIAYLGTTDSKRLLHVVVMFAEGPITAFEEIWFGDQMISPGMIGADGVVLDGRFAGRVRIKAHLGEVDQAADADLVTEVAEWTTAHRLRGIAYLYFRLERDTNRFVTGLPRITALVRGHAVFDPRDSVTRWTPNATVATRAWLTDERFGLGADATTEIDDADTAAAANICDEIVDVEQTSDTVVYDAAEDFLVRPGIATDSGAEQTGWPGEPTTDFVPRSTLGIRAAVFESTGTPPAPLVNNRLYYTRWFTRSSCRLATSGNKAAKGKWIDLQDIGSGTHELVYSAGLNLVLKRIDKRTTVVAIGTTARLRRADPDAWSLRRGDRVTLSTTGTLPAGLSPATDYYAIPDLAGHVALATTLANAIDGTVIAVTDAGSGMHTITRTGQVRYTANGEIVAGTTPRDILAGLNSACAGRVVHSGFTWRLFAGAARTVITDLDESDLAGPIGIETKISRRDRFNGVKGLYVSPGNDGQPADYPPVRSATFAAADGEVIDKEVHLAFTDHPHAAQRIAKIILLTSRQEIVVEARYKLSALRLIASDWASLTIAKYGWSAKAFEALEWKFAAVGNPPALVIDTVLQEVAASDYDWSSNEEQAIDPAPDTELPNPFEPPGPIGVQVSEETYETSGSAGVKARVLVTWIAPDDGFTDRGGFYNVGLRPAGEEEFRIVGTPTGLIARIEDLATGTYDFAVQAINRLGAESDWTVATPSPMQVEGLLAPPVDITGLTLQAISAVAILRWDRHPDLDVRQGGKIRVRHSDLLTNALWHTSSEIAEPVAGDATFAMAPLKAGTYLVRAYDSSGIPSPGIVSVSTKAAEHLAFANIGTITENPLYLGTHSGTVALDEVLTLAGLLLFDDIADFDAVADLDIAGGITPSGTYTFAGGFDFGSVKTVRLEVSSAVLVRNLLELIDDRTALIDDWEDWDGGAAAEGNLQMQFRETDDDPAGSPTWSAWRRLTRADVEARGIECQALLSINDPAYNIEVSALSVSADEIP